MKAARWQFAHGAESPTCSCLASHSNCPLEPDPTHHRYQRCLPFTSIFRGSFFPERDVVSADAASRRGCERPRRQQVGAVGARCARDAVREGKDAPRDLFRCEHLKPYFLIVSSRPPVRIGRSCRCLPRSVRKNVVPFRSASDSSTAILRAAPALGAPHPEAVESCCYDFSCPRRGRGHACHPARRQSCRRRAQRRLPALAPASSRRW